MSQRNEGVSFSFNLGKLMQLGIVAMSVDKNFKTSSLIYIIFDVVLFAVWAL